MNLLVGYVDSVFPPDPGHRFQYRQRIETQGVEVRVECVVPDADEFLVAGAVGENGQQLIRSDAHLFSFHEAVVR